MSKRKKNSQIPLKEYVEPKKQGENYMKTSQLIIQQHETSTSAFQLCFD
jgi:hypothetical protein